MSTDSQSPSRLQMRHIMLKRYLRLGESHTLSEVMGFLTDPRFEIDGLPYLVVIGSDGHFLGMLFPKAIFRAIVGGFDPLEVPESDFLLNLAPHLNDPVAKVMETNIPSLPPDACIEDALLCLRENDAEVIAILEEYRVVGLVTSRILFETSASLTVGALTGGIIPN